MEQTRPWLLRGLARWSCISEAQSFTQTSGSVGNCLCFPYADALVIACTLGTMPIADRGSSPGCLMADSAGGLTAGRIRPLTSGGPAMDLRWPPPPLAGAAGWRHRSVPAFDAQARGQHKPGDTSAGRPYHRGNLARLPAAAAALQHAAGFHPHQIFRQPQQLRRKTGLPQRGPIAYGAKHDDLDPFQHKGSRSSSLHTGRHHRLRSGFFRSK